MTEIGELMAGPAYGNLGAGPHGTFIKMPAGFVSPLHTHDEDYYAVVISGVGVNGLPVAQIFHCLLVRIGCKKVVNRM